MPLTRPPCLLQYHEKLCSFLAKYTKAFVVHADNVGSLQFQNIRKVGPGGSPSWERKDHCTQHRRHGPPQPLP